MEDLAKLIDELLLNVAAYPITLWYLVASPARVFHAGSSSLVCSPAITYLFTAFVSYASIGVLGSRKLGLPKKLREPAVWATLGALYIAVFANLQRWVISLMADVESVPVADQLHMLVYAFCPAAFLASGVMALAIVWRSSAMVLGLPTTAIYVWCLWRGCQEALVLSPGRSAVAAIAAWAIFTAGAVGVGLVLIAASRQRAEETSKMA